MKNSGGKYSSVPKKVVVETLVPSFIVVTLDDDTEELEEASSAIESVVEVLGGSKERPKSQSFVYPSASIRMFSGFRLECIKKLILTVKFE